MNKFWARTGFDWTQTCMDAIGGWSVGLLKKSDQKTNANKPNKLMAQAESIVEAAFARQPLVVA